jgi:curved DNA-binding protein CbpA
LRNYYDLLAIDAAASVDDVKKAFKHEIAKYRPDKVQHLGQEFQAMASALAADLTEAYRVLVDPELRAKYDEDLRLRRGTPEPPPLQWATTPPPHRSLRRQSPRAAHSSRASAVAERPGTSVAVPEWLKTTAIAKLREAVTRIPGAVESSVAGFDAMFLLKPKGGLFRKGDEEVRLLVRFVPRVDCRAVAGAWPLALKAPGSGVPCVLLLGLSVAPPGELAGAMPRHPRKSRNHEPVFVPVDVNCWEAAPPPETPAPVLAVIQRLRDAT